MKKTVSPLIKVCVSLGLLAVSFRFVDAQAVWRLFDAPDPWNLGVAAALLVAAGFCGAGAWFHILRVRLPHIPFAAVAAAHWSGMFFNSFLPSNIGGDVVRGYQIARDSGQTAFAVTSLFIDRFIGLSFLTGFGLIAFVVGCGQTAFAAVLVLTALAAVIAAHLAARRAAPLLRIRLACGTTSRMERALAPALEVAASPRHALPLLACAGATQALRIWQNVFIIRALGLEVPESAVWGVSPVFGLVSALPLSIGGLGVRECAAQALAGPAGLDAAHLTALSLAGHLLVVLVNMLGAGPFLFTKRHRLRALRAGDKVRQNGI